MSDIYSVTVSVYYLIRFFSFSSQNRWDLLPPSCRVIISIKFHVEDIRDKTEDDSDQLTLVVSAFLLQNCYMEISDKVEVNY
jgi:hypothetical protein